MMSASSTPVIGLSCWIVIAMVVTFCSSANRLGLPLASRSVATSLSAASAMSMGCGLSGGTRSVRDGGSSGWVVMIRYRT